MSAKLLLRGARIVPLDGRRQEKRGDVLVEGGRLSAIGGLREHVGVGLVVETKSPILPGFVSAFAVPEHYGLSRGFVPEPRPAALFGDFARFSAALSPPLYADLVRASLSRSTRSGTTASLMPVRPDRASILVGLAAEAGVSVVPALDVSAPGLEPAIESLKARAGGRSDAFALYLGEAERASRRQLHRAARVAEQSGASLVAMLGARGKAGGLKRLEARGALGKRTILVLGTGASLRGPGDLDRLASAGAKLVLVPSYSLYTGLAMPPLAALLERNIGLALGSFSAAFRMGYDAFRELRLLSRVLKDHTDSPASTALEIGTAGGAAALGLEGGELSVGRRADFSSLDVLVDDEADHETLCRLLLERGSPGGIRSVWVEGRVVAADGRLARDWPNFDEASFHAWWWRRWQGLEAGVRQFYRESLAGGAPNTGLIAR